MEYHYVQKKRIMFIYCLYKLVDKHSIVVTEFSNKPNILIHLIITIIVALLECYISCVLMICQAIHCTIVYLIVHSYVSSQKLCKT